MAASQLVSVAAIAFSTPCSVVTFCLWPCLAKRFLTGWFGKKHVLMCIPCSFIPSWMEMKICSSCTWTTQEVTHSHLLHTVNVPMLRGHWQPSWPPLLSWKSLTVKARLVLLVLGTADKSLSSRECARGSSCTRLCLLSFPLSLSFMYVSVGQYGSSPASAPAGQHTLGQLVGPFTPGLGFKFSLRCKT